VKLKVGILGAGIAGLSCACLLAQREVDVSVFESRPYVGGIARSFQWHGFTCDFATHRLFTNDENVLRQLLALVPMGRHVRRSRIRLAGKWVRDPVNIVELLYRYFPLTTARIAFSYLSRPRHANPDSFDSYVLSRYGAGLNELFFKPYTEKMFGISAEEISVEWARRKVRIAGPLDFLRESSKKHFSYFYYPIQGGYGAIANRLYDDVSDQVHLNCTVHALERTNESLDTVVYEQGGQRKREEFDIIISTLPLTILGRMLGFEFPLSYRKVEAVYLLIDQPYVSDSHWFYFIDRDIAINRMVEFKNLSVADCPPDLTVLCAEVTDDYDDVADKVAGDIVRAGMVTRNKILDVMVKREIFGYPVYDRRYQQITAEAKAALGQFSNLYLVGRSAEFEHKEVDDNFASVAKLVAQLCNTMPVAVSTIGRSTEMESTTPLVYAVILTFNHYEDTEECLKSLQALGYDNLSIVVVDNGSSDNTPALVRERFPDVHVIETGHNLGVPWGYNVGFSYALRAGAEYILMLNNDTTVAPDMLRHLVEAGQADPQVGILMPKVLYYDEPDTIWAVGGRYRLFPPAIIIMGQDKPEKQFNEPQFLEYALSCGLLIHRRAFEKAGLFDPGYFFQFDDWDFSQRVRAHGLHIQFVPAARMWHKVSRTTREQGKKALFWRVWGESSARFYRRHGRPLFLSLPVHLGYIMLRELIKGNGRMLKHYWGGVRAGLAKPLGPIPSADDAPLHFVQTEAQ
jgi:GT2 family glycosyltransferase/protoporphyrinogen oxidase